MDVFKHMKSFYWPYKRYFVISMLTLIVVTGITVIYPIILKITIDDIFGKGMYHLAPYLAGLFIILMVLKGIAAYYHQSLGELFGIAAVYDLRNALYRKLQRLPFRYYDNAQTGDLMSRLASDVEAFRFFLSGGFAQVLNFVFLTTFALGVMLAMEVKLALLTLAAMPFLVVAVYRFDKRVHPAFRNIRKAFSFLNTKVQENVSGMHTVKALSKEDFEIERFTGTNVNYKEAHLDAAKIWGKFFPLMELIGNICAVVLLAYGGYLVTTEAIEPGTLVAFFSLIWYLVGPLTQLGFILNTFSQSKAAGERLLEILYKDEPIRNVPDAIRKDRLQGHVQFIDVTHRYEDDKDAALDGVSFDAPPGKVIGLIGMTGSGKTSLTQLISRFYDANKGQILIDGIDIKQYDLESLRKNIGVVFQEAFLFSSTIRDNIAYGRPDIGMDRIIDAAKRADAHEFIQQMPDGYDTILGERGLGLSGGQKQRISIARALCIDPDILILDDATSAVDMETEHKIQTALKEVMHGRTTFIVAHRISSVRHADEILVLEHGRVIERGTHQQLLEHNGAYRRIYDIQYRDRDLVLQSVSES